MEEINVTPLNPPLSPSERRILSTVSRNGPLPRSEIAVDTGLADASVTRLTRDLQDRGLVSDSVRREGLRGQPVRPLRLRPDGAYAFGVNFSHSYADMGLVNFVGELVSHERLRIVRATPESIADLARESLARQIKLSGIPSERLVGAGFSLPGDFLETPRFLNVHAAFPELRGRDLQSAFQSRMPVPVSVENDATSAALGERVHGIGRKHDSFFFIHIGHGVGSGIVIEGRPWRGARGNSGNIGAFFPLSEPRPSGQDLLETLAANGVEVADFDALDALDPATCPSLRRWLARAGDQLGSALHLVSRILDPEVLVVGGRLPPMIGEALTRAIDIDAAFAPSRVLPYPRVVASALGPQAGVIGSASVCFYHVFFASNSDPISPN